MLQVKRRYKIIQHHQQQPMPVVSETSPKLLRKTSSKYFCCTLCTGYKYACIIEIAQILPSLDMNQKICQYFNDMFKIGKVLK